MLLLQSNNPTFRRTNCKMTCLFLQKAYVLARYVIDGRQIHRVIIFDISMVHFAPKKKNNYLNCILSCAQILQRFSSLTISSIRVSVIKDPESTEWISRLQGLTKQETQGKRNKEFIFGTSCIRNVEGILGG